MPYIKKERKDSFETDTKSGHHPPMAVAGELNYEITLKIIKYLKLHGLNYQTCNDIVGALDNAKSEFKRRVQDPYENKKIIDNGDVYPEEFLNGGK